jgi:hypothetical protein
MPLPVTEQNFLGANSATALRWASRQSGAIDWELRPGAYGPFDFGAALVYGCFDLQKRARETRLAACPLVSFVRK